MAKTPKSKCSHPRAARYYNNISKGATMTGYACSNCETTGLAAPDAPAVLAPGIYKLNAPVVNAGKDGRSSDWHSLPSFPTGTYYVTKNVSDFGDGTFRDYGCRIGRDGYGRVRPDHAGYDALAAALVPCEGTTEEFLNFQRDNKPFAGDADVILAHLIETGKISRAEIVAAINEISTKEE